eukprot:scaffold2549_cov177-Ochromonas_danica.AAC.4
MVPTAAQVILPLSESERRAVGDLVGVNEGEGVGRLVGRADGLIVGLKESEGLVVGLSEGPAVRREE